MRELASFRSFRRDLLGLILSGEVDGASPQALKMASRFFAASDSSVSKVLSLEISRYILPVFSPRQCAYISTRTVNKIGFEKVVHMLGNEKEVKKENRDLPEYSIFSVNKNTNDQAVSILSKESLLRLQGDNVFLDACIEAFAPENFSLEEKESIIAQLSEGRLTRVEVIARMWLRERRVDAPFVVETDADIPLYMPQHTLRREARVHYVAALLDHSGSLAIGDCFRTHGHLINSQMTVDHPGYVITGPKSILPAGNYRLNLKCSVLAGCFIADLTAFAGLIRIFQIKFDSEISIAALINIPSTLDLFELRLEAVSDDRNIISIREFALRPE